MFCIGGRLEEHKRTSKCSRLPVSSYDRVQRLPTRKRAPPACTAACCETLYADVEVIRGVLKAISYDGASLSMLHKAVESDTTL